MFVVTLTNGKLLVEGKDIANFNEVPDIGITSMQLLMPYVIHRTVGDKTLKRNAVFAIGRYDKYYCAKQAIANVMSIGGRTGQMISDGQGQVTHEILAGVDERNNEVVYVKLNITTGDVTLDKFNYDWWLKNYSIDPTKLKKGTSKK